MDIAITSAAGAAAPPHRQGAAAIPTILAVDDHELFRMGLRLALNDARREPVALLEASCLRGGMDTYAERKASIDLVLLDLNLPDSRGLSALQTFRRAHPDARIVALAESLDAGVAEEARALGALDVLHKACGVDVFRQIVGLAARRLPLQPHPGGSESSQLRLTPRQLEILDLVVQGRSNQEIGAAAGLKVGTVKNHISWLLVVFGVASRSRLISLFR